jgi:hypothetical protein
VAIQLHEGFLGNVGGIVCLDEHAQAEVVDRRLVASHERLERRGVATPSSQDLLALEAQRL